ncbi:VirK/YbjX family protein [Erwinia sp. OLSSP12]|uniref:VirK/YbjX family protein n=2 Tax=Erwinia TaxID=551 RepID=UPI000C183F91
MTPGKYWLEKKYRRKFVIRSLCMPFHTFFYLSEMAKNPFFNQIIKAQPGLPCRLQRPWMALGISQSQKLAGINNHYRTFCEALPANITDGYLSDRGATLAEISGKNQEKFSIKLTAHDFLSKEGEASLQFCDEENTVLALLTFALVNIDNRKTIFIGGLQGARNETPHEKIQLATKSCHGLFPKRLLTEAMINLARQLSVEQVIAVSNVNHIYASWRYKSRKKDKIHADYDQFWESLGAVQDAKNRFVLPLQMPRKAIDDIASKKRAEYRRRYDLLDQLSAQIAQHCPLAG